MSQSASFFDGWSHHLVVVIVCLFGLFGLFLFFCCGDVSLISVSLLVRLLVITSIDLLCFLPIPFLYISGFVPSFFLCFLVFYIIGDMLTKSCLKFAPFNVEGLCNKLDDNNFKNDISKYGFITLVETWLPTDEQVIF